MMVPWLQNSIFYSTTWSDRIATRTVVNLDGDDDIVYLTGINQNHTGIEV